MPGPNDSLFREVFRTPPEMRSLLRSALPAALVRAIDWSTLTRVEGSWIDGAMREHASDLLFTVSLGGAPALLYILCEHKSGPDPDVLLQLLDNCTRIWKEWRRLQRGGPLPPILPYLLHHGDQPSRGPFRLHDCVDLDALPAEVAAILRRVVPDMGFVLDDLTMQGEAELEARALTAIARISALLLQHARNRPDDEVYAALVRWRWILAEVLAAHGPERLFVLWSYLYRTTEVEPERLVAVLTEVLPPAAEVSLMTTAERLRKEGEARGQVQGRAEMLLRLLARRFGPVPPAIEARIRAAAIPDLDRWGDAVLTAASIDEVLA